MKILFDNKKYLWKPNIVDANPSSCSLNVIHDDTSGIVVITPINPPLEYEISVNRLEEKTKLLKITYTLTDSNGIENDDQYEYFLIIRQASVIDNYGYYVTLEDLLKYVAKEESICHDILWSTLYKNCSYNTFLRSDTIDVGINVMYDENNTKYIGSPGSYIEDTLISGSNYYDSFLAHVDSDSGLEFNLFYSTENTDWIMINADEKIEPQLPFRRLSIRIVWGNSSDLSGISVYYGNPIVAPVIDHIYWNSYVHYNGSSYEMTIEAREYWSDGTQEGNFTYEVRCEDSNVVIEQNALDPKKFNIVYPNYPGTTVVRFYIKAINENGLYAEVFTDQIVNT